jgi:hypothetical protein
MSKDLWGKFLYVAWGYKCATLEEGICAGGPGEVDSGAG